MIIATYDNDEESLYGCMRYVEGNLYRYAWTTSRERDMSIGVYALHDEVWRNS